MEGTVKHNNQLLTFLRQQNYGLCVHWEALPPNTQGHSMKGYGFRLRPVCCEVVSLQILYYPQQMPKLKYFCSLLFLNSKGSIMRGNNALLVISALLAYHRKMLSHTTFMGSCVVEVDLAVFFLHGSCVFNRCPKAENQ